MLFHCFPLSPSLFLQCWSWMRKPAVCTKSQYWKEPGLLWLFFPLPTKMKPRAPSVSCLQLTPNPVPSAGSLSACASFSAQWRWSFPSLSSCPRLLYWDFPFWWSLLSFCFSLSSLFRTQTLHSFLSVKNKLINRENNPLCNAASCLNSHLLSLTPCTIEIPSEYPLVFSPLHHVWFTSCSL